MKEVVKKTLVAVTIEDGEYYRPTAAIHKKEQGSLSPAIKQFLNISQ
jgi:hypothetical protein